MTAVTRRRFLHLTGATTAASLLSSSIARAAAIGPHHRTGTIRDVEHVVVLMQENRSFDHYFGTLRGVRGFGDPRPATLPNGKSVWHQADAAGNECLPFRPDADGLGLRFLDGLDHSWEGGHQAWNQGRYDRWIPAKGPGTMGHFSRRDIPFHFALADAFTVCDAYHCSLMTSTDPNRYYMWTGYTGNDGSGGGPVLNNAEAGYGWKTYPERLEAAGISWKIYQDTGTGLDADGSWGWTDDAYIGNYGDNSVLYFHQYQNAKPGDPLYDKARTGTNAASGQSYFDVLAADVKAGELPQVSWIVAPEAFSEHPNWPVNYGAWYIAQVLDALTADPEVWSKTALFITYDENDGFFDHVVPPFVPGGPVQGAATMDVSDEWYPGGAHPAGSYGLGQRVPMLVVSPWSRGGWVNSQTFDHTSIIRFMEERFGVREPNISDWRRAVCGDLTSAFDFGRTDEAVPDLPSTDGYLPPDRDRHPSYPVALPADPAMPKQEPGRRPARALPYDLAADGTVAGGDLSVIFASHGPVGAAFIVSSTTDNFGPRSYTVGARRAIEGRLPIVGGSYGYAIRGANGFLRELHGTPAAALPEVAVIHDGGAKQVRLVLTNSGTEEAELTVVDAYGHHGPATVRVEPGHRTVHAVPTAASSGWYDLTVTSAQDATYLRRAAGHLEDGRASLSDPAILVEGGPR